MIIEPVVRNEGQADHYYEIINVGDPYWALGYTPDKVVRLISEEKVTAKVLASKFQGFGADSITNLLAEAESRGLTFADGLIIPQE